MLPPWTDGELRKLLEPVVPFFLPDSGPAGIVAGITCGGSRHFLALHSGKSDASSGPPMDEDTLFEIGAATMAFTAALLADMVRTGEVHLDDPVRKFLPASVRVPSRRGQEITLLDLATHSAGLPRLPSNFPATVLDWKDPCANYTEADLHEFLSTHDLAWPIGTRREFSNLGMGLLGHVLAQADGRPFEDAVRARVCAPLGLNDITVTLSPEQEQRFIQGHTSAGLAAGPWGMASLVGAGGLRSTARDLLRFLEANLSPQAPLSEALELCRRPHPKSGQPTPWPLRYGIAAGLTGLGLTVQHAASVVPGNGWFVPLFLAPVFLSALAGGLGPGALALLAGALGTWLQWGLSVHLLFPAGLGLALAWLASSNHRERARPSPLGWHQESLNLFGLGSRILWHSGETGGYASFLGLAPDTGVAVVLLSSSAIPLPRLGLMVLRLLHRTERPVSH
jgi:CubicO group peptidase (beta-lactamase class C family)